jgi:hypothetical protein
VRFVAGWGQNLALVFALVIIALPNAALAITTLSQGYTTSDQVSSGSIVSLKEGLQDHVVAATPDSSSPILGVVISDNNSLLSLWSGQAAQQVQVATSGIVQVLVSDINGKIEDGDQITASPISGVGMRATSNAKVVGVAQGSQDNNNSSEQSYKDKQGEAHKVKLGLVPALINVSYFYKQPEKTLIPSAVQNIANALAGKKVDSLPILVSMGIFIITLIVVASILYAMIRSSIISVGRNPMSQAAIYRQLTQMSALVVGIIGAATISIYMVLTKF